MARMLPAPVWLCLGMAALATPGPGTAAPGRPIGLPDTPPSAAATVPAPEGGPPAPNLPLRNAVVLGTGAALVAAYGFTNWWEDGFSGGFSVEHEDWFGQGTEYGGVDKLGHFYANYVGVRLLTPIFEAVGNDHATATRIATLATFVTFATVEVVDGLSERFDFGPEDFVANIAGVVFGYAAEKSPRLDDLLDFRLDYRKSDVSPNWDPFGDYEGQRYLLVAKMDAFEALRSHRATRYLELAVGYGAEGYDPPPGPGDPPGRRTFYVGLGLNLSRILADAAYDGRKRQTAAQRAAEVAFDVLQLPVIVYGEEELD